MGKAKIDIWSRVDKMENGCWIWNGPVTPTGYGRAVNARGQSDSAHRVAWELLHGELEKGLFIARSCKSNLCICPDHLVASFNRRTRSLTGAGMSKASQEKAPAKGPRKSNEPVHWLVVVSGLKDDFWVSVNVHLVDSRKKQAEKRALTIASLQGLSRAEVKSVDKKPMRITE